LIKAMVTSFTPSVNKQGSKVKHCYSEHFRGTLFFTDLANFKI
jgi:hypothetical protein